MNDDDRKVLQAMESYGGGFVKALSQAWLRADPCNFERLRLAFPQYWDHYRRLALLQPDTLVVESTELILTPDERAALLGASEMILNQSAGDGPYISALRDVVGRMKNGGH